MSSIFAGPKLPAPKPPAPMPDQESVAFDTARQERERIRGRSGRRSTILSEAGGGGNKSFDSYANRTLGSGA